MKVTHEKAVAAGVFKRLAGVARQAHALPQDPDRRLPQGERVVHNVAQDRAPAVLYEEGHRGVLRMSTVKLWYWRKAAVVLSRDICPQAWEPLGSLWLCGGRAMDTCPPILK